MAEARRRRRGHGWWPYLLPMVSFLVLVEVGSRFEGTAASVFFFLKVLVPGGLFLHYVLQGNYPELRGFRWDGRVGLDVAVGLAGAALWMAPFVLVDAWRPDEEGFDPNQLGADMAWLAIAVRAVGYAAVTPFVEELFVRSWLLRYIDVFDTGEDFRDVPIARFRWRSFLIVTFYFVLSHVPWEYPVMLLWTLGTMAWFYHRKSLMALVVVHAVTNGAILAFAALFDGRLLDAQGQPIGLWFFV